MIALYHCSDDEANQRLIEVFLGRAGDGWLKKLHSQKQTLLSKFATANHRAEKHSKGDQISSNSITTKARYYRGALVEG